MKNQQAHVILILFLLFINTALQLTAQNIYKDSSVPIEARIKDLISQMTLAEKIGQMQQNHLSKKNDEVFNEIKLGKIGSFLNAGDINDKFELQKIAVEESRLGIPLIYGRDVIHGFKTIFPIPLGQAATWNPEIVKLGSAAAASEAAEVGIHWTFAPMVDISRDPRWGRIAESCGEDPYLAAKMGSAMVEGFQGNDLSSESSIAACAKHFVGYGAAESGKDYNTTIIPERYMRDIYLPPFKSCIDVGAATLMSAFNDINGVPASGNEFTLKRVLRDEWKFDGFVVSDWASMTEMINHGFCADETEVAYKSVKAGVNMEMVSQSYANNLEKLIKEGKVSEDLINEMVEGILRVKFRLGLFENPYKQLKEKSQTLSAEHLTAARESAEQSLVLLQNTDDFLPLSKLSKTIAVIGPLADDAQAQLGCWSPDGDPENSITPLKAIKQLLGEKTKVIFAAGLDNCRSTNTEKFAEAVTASKAADAVIMILGEDDLLSGESHSRAFIDLPGAQEELIKTIAETGKPIVLVIMAGRPLTFGNIVKDVKSILYAWHPGTMGGPAIANILFGNVSPSGKLPVTFPRTVGQVPIYYSHKNTGRPPSENQLGIKMGTPENPVGFASYYLDVDYTPAYPFGFGLSYTTFEYHDLKLSSNEILMGGKIEVSATIKNTGKYDAEEVVQLYVRDLFGNVTRPVKELKGFKKIHLKAGEEKVVTFSLSTGDLAFWNIDMKYAAESGDFTLWIGGDSQKGLKADFKIK